MMSKKDCLDCLFQEINILTECRHANIVKILDASFDGIIETRQTSTPMYHSDHLSQTHQSESFGEQKYLSGVQKSTQEEIKAVLHQNKQKIQGK